MHTQVCLEFWEPLGKRVPIKSQSCSDYIPAVLTNTELVTDICYQTTETRELLYCGVNFYTEEKGFLCALFLLIAITPLLLSNLNRIKPRSRIRKGKRAKRQQKTK